MAPAPMWSETDLLSVLGAMQNNYIAAPSVVPGAGGGSDDGDVVINVVPVSTSIAPV